MFKVMFRLLKNDILFGLLLFLCEATFKIGFSVNLLFLYDAVIDRKIRSAYILGAVAGVLWFIGVIFRHNAFYQALKIHTKFKSSLIQLLHWKVSTLTSYIAKNG